MNRKCARVIKVITVANPSVAGRGYVQAAKDAGETSFEATQSADSSEDVAAYMAELRDSVDTVEEANEVAEETLKAVMRSPALA